MISVAAALNFGAGQAGVSALRSGWSAPEADFVWSVGAESSLELPPPPGPDGVSLEITLMPCVRQPDVPCQRLAISVNGQRIAERVLRAALTWRLPVPAECLRGARTLAITLHHPDARAPASLQPGDDPRALAFCLRRLVLLHDPGRASLPTPAGRLRRAAHFHFGANETTQAMLGEGWGEPEPGHVWAVGRHSVLRLPLPKDAGQFTIVLNLRPLADLPALKQQRIAIGANGKLLHYVALRQHTVLALDLPVCNADTADGGFVELTFDNLDAAAPRSEALYKDGRPFAFMLHDILLLVEQTRLSPAAAARQAIPGSIQEGSLPAAVQSACGLDAATLLANFVSLGCVCELGLLQRRFGCEPPGLMRFAGAFTPALVDGLLRGFAGLGRPDTLEILRRTDWNRGYFVVDSQYALVFQTPVGSVQTGEPALLRQLSRIVPFLVRQFFTDIVASEKLFVFQRREPSTRLEAEAVLAALATWGDPTLLWTVHDPAAEPGSVVRLGPRLLCGFLDAPAGPDYASDDAWLSVLANAWCLTQQEFVAN
jgi:hypothetical protein